MGGVCALKVRIHPSLILWLSILFYLSPGLVLPFLFAAGFHEAGHTLMLWKLGKSPKNLILSFSGAKLETPPMGYREERLAAAAGPMCSFLLSLLWPVLPVTALYSFILGLINLFPVPGLDGFRILKTTLYLRVSQERAEQMTNIISYAFSITLSLCTSFLAAYLGLGLWPVILVAVFLLRTIQRPPC